MGNSSFISRSKLSQKCKSPRLEGKEEEVGVEKVAVNYLKTENTAQVFFSGRGGAVIKYSLGSVSVQYSCSGQSFV